jgi:ribosomal protein S26
MLAAAQLVRTECKEQQHDLKLEVLAALLCTYRALLIAAIYARTYACVTCACVQRLSPVRRLKAQRSTTPSRSVACDAFVTAQRVFSWSRRSLLYSAK